MLRVVADRKTQFLARQWRELKRLHSKHGGWRFPVRRLPSTPLEARESTGFDCAFVVSALQLAVRPPSGLQAAIFGDLLAPEVVHVLEEIVTSADGLKISQLLLTPFVEDETWSAAIHSQALGQLVESILCRGCSDDVSRAVLKSVKLLGTPVYAAWFAWTCSAAVEAQSMRELSCDLEGFGDNPELMLLVLECLACALFSQHPRARSSIASVTLTGAYIDQEDASMIANVLALPDLTNFLFGKSISDDEGLEREPGQVKDAEMLVVGTLKKGTFVELHQMGEQLRRCSQAHARIGSNNARLARALNRLQP